MTMYTHKIGVTVLICTWLLQAGTRPLTSSASLGPTGLALDTASTSSRFDAGADGSPRRLLKTADRKPTQSRGRVGRSPGLYVGVAGARPDYAAVPTGIMVVLISYIYESALIVQAGWDGATTAEQIPTARHGASQQRFGEAPPTRVPRW